MNYLDLIGWFGSFSLLTFYWFLGSGKIGLAYFFSTLGAALWLVVGVTITFFNVSTSNLPSLIFLELTIIIMNIRGMIQWKNKKIVEKENHGS